MDKPVRELGRVMMRLDSSLLSEQSMMTPKPKLAQGLSALVARKDHCFRKLHSKLLGDWTLEIGSGYGYGFRLLRLEAIVAILLHHTTVRGFHL